MPSSSTSRQRTQDHDELQIGQRGLTGLGIVSLVLAAVTVLFYDDLVPILVSVFAPEVSGNSALLDVILRRSMEVTVAWSVGLVAMGLTVFLVGAALLAFVIAAFRWTVGSSSGGRTAQADERSVTPIEAIHERYLEGEIDDQELETLLGAELTLKNEKSRASNASTEADRMTELETR